ncbi:hypothetical protein GCM10008018_36630 [Paenibacillus marchantiophytorum]|uniref:DUF669 domain-containing protein n=1 Tax=Paenibacillus marchantiophytorum TaxID=1619310 RepID=A0ABQ1EU11_9BACL|nr:DUF669 domain-containing protein [Paenibacillus marchantiophytorum]GFZ87146.1 hypothetical protein GCM10008018_36630 [Paenibacillus marchantiophytorum]
MDLKSLIFKEEVLPPENKYEAIIIEAKPTIYRSGNSGINMKLMIRPDVEQDAQEEEIDDCLVYTEKSIYKYRMLGKAIKAVSEQPWNSLPELARLLFGKPVSIHVKHKQDMYDQTVAYISMYGEGQPFERHPVEDLDVDITGLESGEDPNNAALL